MGSTLMVSLRKSNEFWPIGEKGTQHWELLTDWELLTEGELGSALRGPLRILGFLTEVTVWVPSCPKLSMLRTFFPQSVKTHWTFAATPLALTPFCPQPRHMYVYIYIYIYIHMYITYICTYVHIHVYMYIYTCMNVCMYVDIHVYMYAHILCQYQRSPGALGAPPTPAARRTALPCRADPGNLIIVYIILIVYMYTCILIVSLAAPGGVLNCILLI